MLGETRDAETAEICLRAALTGHLVLSTLHTNDALSPFPVWKTWQKYITTCRTDTYSDIITKIYFHGAQVNNKPSLTAIYTALACTILSLLTFGYLFNGEPNLIQVLPFAFKSADPSLFPHDFFVASASSFPSFYPYLLGKALAVFGIYKFHFIAYVLTRFAVLWLTFLLAFELFGKTEIAVLSCVLAAASPFCNMLTLLGEDPILKTAFFQTSLAAPMTFSTDEIFRTSP